MGYGDCNIALEARAKEEGVLSVSFTVSCGILARSLVRRSSDGYRPATGYTGMGP